MLFPDSADGGVPTETVVKYNNWGIKAGTTSCSNPSSPETALARPAVEASNLDIWWPTWMLQEDRLALTTAVNKKPNTTTTVQKSDNAHLAPSPAKIRLERIQRKITGHEKGMSSYFPLFPLEVINQPAQMRIRFSRK